MLSCFSCKLLLSSSPIPLVRKQCCIMIDPAGSADDPGRLLESHYERGLTLQCAERIQQLLETQDAHLAIVITRTAGQTTSPLQHAQYANRLGVDLYVHLSFYKEEAWQPAWHLFTYTYGQRSPYTLGQLVLLPYTSAYIVNYKKTLGIIEQWRTLLTHHMPSITFMGGSLPHAALAGITVPACVLEIGLVHDAEWKECAVTIATTLALLVDAL